MSNTSGYVCLGVGGGGGGGGSDASVEVFVKGHAFISEVGGP